MIDDVMVNGGSRVEAERKLLRAALGKVGLWSFQLDHEPTAAEGVLVAAVEASGLGSLWVPEGTASKDALVHSATLLAASERLVIGTGIANIWARDATAMASASRHLAEAFPGRFILGMGVSHAGALQRRGHTYQRPLAMMTEYLEHMRAAELRSPAPLTGPTWMLAALRPRMLELAATTHGAHTYFVPPEHTELARDVLGPDPLLVPELAVVFDSDPTAARAIAREHASHYLARENYARNLAALGFDDDDLRSGGSDRLVDSIVAWGDSARIAARVVQHLDAGADHVAVQVLTRNGALSVADVDRVGELAAVVSATSWTSAQPAT